ncbi:phosphodiester glycosidase family protein [Gabonia massiliensis]|uniref:phosphodiester glycosidase family protein n=1 Tax=Gabonia massiliensis TaxID=1686296 RepID=UPI0009EAA5E2|nr:phosphodiester glycosidase family protein [Gabonia massiliensis]
MKNYLVSVFALFSMGVGLHAANTGDVWVMPCTELQENYQNFPAEENNRVVLGRGETEHIQLVFSTIPKEEITLSTSSSPQEFGVQYRILREIDGFDDALVPFESKTKAEKSTTVVWLTFETPRDARPGTYDYSVNVKSIRNNVTLNFKVRVADYEIPLTPSIPSEFCVDIDNLPENGSDEQKELWTEFLLTRRIDPYYGKIIDPSIWRWDNCFSPWPWDDPRSQKLLQDKRFCRFALPCLVDDEEILRMCADMKEKGYFDRCYFYIWDEPKTPAHYEQIAKESAHILSLEPEAKMLVPISSSLIEGENKWDYKYTFDFLTPYVKILPISAEEYKCQNSVAQDFRKMIEPRAEWWTYVCCGPVGVQPNFLFSQTPFHNRAIMWRVYKENETGFLYWGVNRYRMEPFAFDRSLDAVGDGGLVFPGYMFGVKEPIASARLERWKEGQEDYELLKIVEGKVGRQNAEKILEQVYRSPSDYTRNSGEIEAFREKLIQIAETYDSFGQVLIRGEQYLVDTLNAYIPGPGCEYSHIRIDELPIEAHVLKVDLQNPNTRVKTFLGNDLIEGLETVSSACDRYTTGTADAFAGINGDFFNISAHKEFPIGAPRGGCVSEGIIQREPRSMEWAFAAIDDNNKPILDNMAFSGSVVSLKAPIASYTFNDVNLPRTDCYSCDMTFYNEFAGGYTRMDENAEIGDKLKTEVFFKLADGQAWKINSPITCIVTRIIKDTEGKNALKPGEAALSGIDQAKGFLDKLTVGQKLKINMTIKTAGNETPAIREMIGGNSLLMKDGVIMECNFNDSYNNVLYPRTGVGCSADGRWLYLMVIDGRQAHSRGVYSDEMCDLFRSAGASDVVGFDGGGSTGMVVNHTVVNRPSDGQERAVTNGWLLQTTTPVDWEIVRLAFNYWNKEQINSLSLPLRLMGYNQYNVLVDSDLSPVTWSCSPELGHIEGETLILKGTDIKGTVTGTYNGMSVSRHFNFGETTGLESVSKWSRNVKFYKDKSANLFYLSQDGNGPCKMAYALYTLDGHCMRQGESELSGTYCFDFTDMPSGLYLLKVNMEMESFTFKLIIR